ncbi:MAG: hypothetical protein WCK35_19785 [Chloroflexota bacterium]
MIETIKQDCPPILFLIFNRPDVTYKVFERIREARPRQLYIAADGPRLNVPTDIEDCELARQVVKLVNWDCEVQTLFRERNLGCKLGVRSAIDWFFEQVEAGIILEDDCLPSPDFFSYCAELLERHKDHTQILSINGFNFGYHADGPFSYSFTHYFNMWGWATWRRCARQIDYQMEEWGLVNKNWFLLRVLRSWFFDFDWKWIKHWRTIFDELAKNSIDTWDYYWVYSGLKTGMFSIVPHRNLIKNIGFNNDATHTRDAGHPVAQLEADAIEIPIVHPIQVRRNRFYEEEYIKKIWHGYLRRPFYYQLWAFYRDVLRPESLLK